LKRTNGCIVKSRDITQAVGFTHFVKDLVELSKQDYKYRDKRSDHLSQDRIAGQVGQLDRLRIGTSREDTSSLPINVFIIWKPFQRHHSVKYE